jgi:ribose transport system substrate-binding protein
MYLRAYGWLTAGIACCALLSACNGSHGSGAKYRIAVIPKGTSHDFWKFIHAGAVAAARERGEIEVIWDGPAKEDLRHEQQQIVERFTTEHVDAMILAPCDRQTLVHPVERAIEQRIPVVVMDSGLDLPNSILDDDRYLGYIATDNRRGGSEAAIRMNELMKGKAHPKVMMIRYQAGSESTEQREDGFRTFFKSMPSITFIEARDEAGATADSAQKVAERLLSDNKDLDGIFTPNESSTVGTLRALEVLHRTGEVRLVGFDSSEILIEALAAGKLHGLVLQDPFGMGYLSVMRAADFVTGQPIPRNRTKYTELKVATRENMNEPAIKNLYARDLGQYLNSE